MDIEQEDVVPGSDDKLIIDFSGTDFVQAAREPPDKTAFRRLVGVDFPGVSGLLVELEDGEIPVRHPDDLEPGPEKAGGRTGLVSALNFVFQGFLDNAPDLGFGQIILRGGLDGHQGRGQGQARDHQRENMLLHNCSFWRQHAQIMYRLPKRFSKGAVAVIPIVL